MCIVGRLKIKQLERRIIIKRIDMMEEKTMVGLFCDVLEPLKSHRQPGIDSGEELAIDSSIFTP